MAIMAVVVHLALLTMLICVSETRLITRLPEFLVQEFDSEVRLAFGAQNSGDLYKNTPAQQDCPARLAASTSLIASGECLAELNASRYTCDADATAGNYLFVIHRLGIDDVGTYTAQDKNGVGDKSPMELVGYNMEGRRTDDGHVVVVLIKSCGNAGLRATCEDQSSTRSTHDQLTGCSTYRVNLPRSGAVHVQCSLAFSITPPCSSTNFSHSATARVYIDVLTTYTSDSASLPTTVETTSRASMSVMRHASSALTVMLVMLAPAAIILSS